jgi:hypothetical protein
VVTALVVWLLLSLGTGFGYVLRALLERANRTRWPVRCGQCASEREPGPRRQLSVELWDSYGMQYKQWRVGTLGELLDTRAVGPWLLQAIATEVLRLERFQRDGLVRAPTGDAVVPNRGDIVTKLQLLTDDGAGQVTEAGE